MQGRNSANFGKIKAVMPLWRLALTLALIALQVVMTTPGEAWGAAGKKLFPKGKPASNSAPLRGLTSVVRPKPLAGVQPAVPVFSAPPTDSEIAHAQIFAEQLVKIPTASPSADENVALGNALRRYAQTRDKENLEEFETFLKDFPDSGWKISLLAELGVVYRQTGYFSRAIDVWDTAWQLGKKETDPALKSLSDKTAGRLAGLLARLGRQDRLQSLLDETKDRKVNGTAAEWLNSAGSALSIMRAEPETSFQCGPLALNQIRGAQDPKLYNDKRVLGFHSTSQGTSLDQIRKLSKTVGMNWQIAYRTPGAPVLTPAVAHWKAGHFAALIGTTTTPSASSTAPVRYKIEDPTFAESNEITQRALDLEGSGYFLVPPQKLPEGWRTVDDKEGATVWGKGVPEDGDPNAQRCGSSRKGGNGGGCGMASYSVFEMLLSLSMTDTPIGYRPPKGPQVAFTIRYSHRQNRPVDTSGHFNFGPLWTCDWLSYIEEPPTGTTVSIFMPGGGGETYKNPNPVTGAYDLEYESASQLVRLPDPNNSGQFIYERRSPNGSKAVYAQSYGVSPRRIFLTQVVDGVGNAVKLVYDNAVNGPGLRLTEVQDATGDPNGATPLARKATILQYDSVNQLLVTGIVDPFGRYSTLEYYPADTNGIRHLKRITDVIGVWSQFEYDAAGFITSLETPYDAGTPQGKTRFAKGQVPNASEPQSQFIEITDCYGDKERLEYNRHGGNVNTVQNMETTVPKGLEWLNTGLGNMITFFWNKTAMNDPSRSYDTATSYTHWLKMNGAYMVSDIPHSIKNRFHNRIWFAYEGQTDAQTAGTSARPILAAVVKSNGETATSRIEYNNQGQPLKVVDPLGRTTFVDYGPNGVDPVKIRQAVRPSYEQGVPYETEVISRMSYNGNHLPIQVTDASGATTLIQYDSQGRVSQTTNALGHTSSVTYNALGQMTQATGPVAEARVLYEYDQIGRVSAVIDSDNYRVEMQYDNFDRVTRVTYPDQTYAEYTYDKLDLVGVRDRMGKTAALEYDALRRVTKVTDSLNRQIVYTYCNCGGLGSMTVLRPDAPNGAGGFRHQTTSWSRDPIGRVITKSLPDGTTSSVVYDSATGQVISTTDPRGVTTRFQYYLDGQVKQVNYELPTVAPQTQQAQSQTNPAEKAKKTAIPSVKYEYDAAYGRLVAVTDGLGRTTYEYNNVSGFVGPGAGELKKVVTPKGDVFEYGYDLLGRVTTRTVNSSTETVTYDNLGRITQTVNSFGTFTGEYDGVSGRLTKLTNPNGTSTEYLYGTLAQEFRLQSITHKKGSDQISKHQYQYALDGTITNWTRTVGNGTPRSETYGYDNANQLTSATLTEGTATLRTLGYQYDLGQNRTQETGTGTADLTPVANYNAAEWDALGRITAIIGDNRRTEFEYDGGDRRVRIVEKVNGAVVNDSRFVWDGTGIVEERDGQTNQLRKRFTGNGEQLFDAQGVEQGKYFYASDHLGSAREITDQSGNVVSRFDYDPYGRATQTAGTFKPTFGFANYHTLWNEGLCLTLYRALDPNNGRWLRRDPIGEAGGINLFGYVGNNPINSFDPLGLCSGDPDGDYAQGYVDNLVDSLAHGIAYAGVFGIGAVVFAANPIGLAFLAVAAVTLLVIGAMTYQYQMQYIEAQPCPNHRAYLLGQLHASLVGGIVGGQIGAGLATGPFSKGQIRTGGGPPEEETPNVGGGGGANTGGGGSGANTGGGGSGATTPGGVGLTTHAQESLIRHGFKEPFYQVDEIIGNPSRTRIQDDGGTVYIQRSGGRNRTYNVIIVGENGQVVTGLRNISPNELIRLGENYGFDPHP